MQRIIVFEDRNYNDLHPLTDIRPCFLLRCGAYSLLERMRNWCRRVSLQFWALPEREAALAACGILPQDIRQNGGPAVVVNARAFLTADIWQRILKARSHTAFCCGGELVAAVIQEGPWLSLSSAGPDPENLKKLMGGGKVVDLEQALAVYPWDYVNRNGGMIEHDFRYFGKAGGRLDRKAILLGRRQYLKLSPGASLEPGVIVDVRQGPVIIDSGAVVRGPGRIEGPCYIGPDCLVDGAKLRPGVSLGRGCRVSGEVEETIFMEFSNKHHDGFLGHSYVGSWVNLGAQTCNSDLKNNYENVRVWLRGKSVDTGSIKVGCFVGDHTKMAIGTLINTGSVIGTGSNIFGGGVHKYLPPFTWGHSGSFTEHNIEKMLATAETAMRRRRQALTPQMSRALRKLFEETSELRKKLMEVAKP